MFYLFKDNSPTKARITVKSGAAGNEIVVLNSNICKSSTMKTNIWCWEYLNNMVMDTVWKNWLMGNTDFKNASHLHRNESNLLTNTIMTREAAMYADEEVQRLTKW